MKYFIALSAVLIAASALPLEAGTYEEPLEAGPYDESLEAGTYVEPYDYHPVDDITTNVSSRFHTGLIGFGAGTTGGAGGATWNVWDAWALQSALNSAETRRVVVQGRIDMSVLFVSSPGVRIPCGPRKTVEGANRNAEIFGGGIRLNNQVHVIFRNLRFTNAISFAPGERPNGSGGITNQQPGEFSEIDNLDIESSERIWVDHCEFSDDPHNSANTAANRRRHDGLIDIKRGSSHISISNSIFRNHNHVGLIGHADNNAAQDNGRLRVTYYYNWFRGTTQRNPRVRFGRVHVLNNLFTDIIMYGTGVGAGASIHFERNVCINSRRCWGFASGVPNPAGQLFANNNWLTNSGHDAGIPGNVNWNPGQHYSYTPQAAANVEAYVRRTAGPR